MCNPVGANLLRAFKHAIDAKGEVYNQIGDPGGIGNTLKLFGQCPLIKN